jgi:hypothetical protein
MRTTHKETAETTIVALTATAPAAPVYVAIHGPADEGLVLPVFEPESEPAGDQALALPLALPLLVGMG